MGQLPPSTRDRPDVLEFRFKNLDSVLDRIARFDERARYWLVGKESWFFKEYVEGKIGIVLDFQLSGELAKPIQIVDERAPFNLEHGSVNGAHSGHNQPVLVDVVGIVDAPDKVACRASSVAFAVRHDAIEDDRFQVWVVPSQFANVFRPPSRSIAVKRAFQARPFLVERKDDPFIADAGSVTRQSGYKVVERSTQVVNAVPDLQADGERQVDPHNGWLSCLLGVYMHPSNGFTVMLDRKFPNLADVVRVLTCPMELCAGLDKPMIGRGNPFRG